MEYIRKPIKVDAVQMPTNGAVGVNEFHAGDYLVTYEDGSVAVLPPDVFEANFEPGTTTSPIQIVNKPLPQQQPSIEPKPEPSGELANKDALTCLICSQDVMPDNFDRRQGICFDCLKVKCPTCHSIVKRSEMKGQYCPNCLGSPVTL